MIPDTKDITHNCASPTPTFGTAKLGARKADASEVFEQSNFWVHRIKVYLGSIEIECDRIFPVRRSTMQCVQGFGRNGRLNQPRSHEEERGMRYGQGTRIVEGKKLSPFTNAADTERRQEVG